MQLFALSAIIIQVWIFKVHILHAFNCNYCLYCSSDLVWYWPEFGSRSPTSQKNKADSGFMKNQKQIQIWILDPDSAQQFQKHSVQCCEINQAGFSMHTLLCVKWWGRLISWIKLTWRVRIQRLARRLRVRKCVRVWGMKTDSLFLYVLVRFERTECFYKIW